MPLLLDLALAAPPTLSLWGAGFEHRQPRTTSKPGLAQPLGEGAELQRAVFATDKRLVLSSSQLVLNWFPVSPTLLILSPADATGIFNVSPTRCARLVLAAPYAKVERPAWILGCLIQ